MVVPGSLDPLWEVSPFRDVSTGNTPPVLKLQGGDSIQGPRPISAEVSTTVSHSLTLSVSVSDDAKAPLFGFVSSPGLQKPKSPPVTVTWSKFRGPGEVTFANAQPAVELANGGQVTDAGVSGSATTAAKFSEPGEYILLVVANDWSGPGGHGYQCCWTNAEVKVSVKP